MTSKMFTAQEQAIIEDLMLHRRDIRGNNFLPDAVTDEEIEKILHAASLAPSVGFSQPWQFVIIKDKQIKQQVLTSFEQCNQTAQQAFSGKQQTLYNELKLEGIVEAPVNIAVFYQNPSAPILGQNSMPEMGEYSVVCAIQNMWLMSRAMNLGLGWVSILNPEEVKEIVKAPSDHKLIAYLCLGHVKKFHATPELERLEWEKRKNLALAVHHESFS